VGGHVGKDETYEAAVTRELQEELGVSVPLVAAHKFLFSYPHETEIETLFTGQSNGPFHPQPEEVAQVSFISKNELPRKLLSGEIQLTQLADHALRLVGFL
jgi:NADH pyrophosphatase NudC (nudix superfamily)